MTEKIWADEPWVEYHTDRSVEVPTEGYIEYMDTFDDKRYLCDMNQPEDMAKPLIWNRGSGSPIKKFRYISPEVFHLQRIASHGNMITTLNATIKEHEKTIAESEKILSTL
jgi:hypothetical protein